MAEPPQDPDQRSYHEAACAWFAKGDGDLRSAVALLELDPPETEATAFHSQQAAEKYLKGFLAFHGEEPPRIHDLSVLLDLALGHHADFEMLRTPAYFLVPYAVEVRYPFAGEPPTEEEAREAVKYAQMVCDRVRTVTFPKDSS